MRKFTVIILLASFVLAQYAKQVSYLECKLYNYFIVSAEKCDCEKIMKSDNVATDPSPVPTPHNHGHVDESYFPPLWPNQQKYFAGKSDTNFVSRDAELRNGIYNKPDHPPQFS